MFRLILRVVSSARILPTLDLAGSKKQGDGSGSGPGCVVHAQLLKQQQEVSFPMSLQKQNQLYYATQRLLISY